MSNPRALARARVTRARVHAAPRSVREPTNTHLACPNALLGRVRYPRAVRTNTRRALRGCDRRAQHCSRLLETNPIRVARADELVQLGDAAENSAAPGGRNHVGPVLC